MGTLHHSLGTSGLRLRTTRGIRALALANNGPLLEGAYESQATLEAAERNRVVAEVALDVASPICLALDDAGELVARDAGDPNPQFTLYRLVPTPVDGTEYIPSVQGGELLSAEIDRCDLLAWWQIGEPTVLATTDDALDATVGWVFSGPRLLALANFPLDNTAGWELTPVLSTPATDGGIVEDAVVSGNLSYPTELASDWGALGAYTALLRLWFSSNGPFQAIAGHVFGWYALRPAVSTGFAFGPPYYDRAAANGAGELVTALPADPQDTVCIFSGSTGWDPAGPWSLFIVLRAHELPATQRCVAAANMLNDPAQTGIEVHAGTATEGLAIVRGTSRRVFANAIGTTRSILEITAAAGATNHQWAALVNGTAQAEAATEGAAAAWSGPWPPRFYFFGGVGAANFRGAISEIILLQTDDATVRAAVRSHLATKFAITLP